MKQWTQCISIVAILFIWSLSLAFGQSALALLERGYGLFKSNDFQTAEQILRMGLNKSPNNALGHYYLAETLVRLGKTDEAVQHYQLTMKLSPESTEGMEALVKVTRMRSTAENSRNDKLAVLNALNPLADTAHFVESTLPMSSSGVSWSALLRHCIVIVSGSIKWDQTTLDVDSRPFKVRIWTVEPPNRTHTNSKILGGVFDYGSTVKWVGQTLDLTVDEYPAFAAPSNINQNFNFRFIGIKKSGADVVINDQTGHRLRPATNRECQASS